MAAVIAIAIAIRERGKICGRRVAVIHCGPSARVASRRCRRGQEGVAPGHAHGRRERREWRRRERWITRRPCSPRESMMMLAGSVQGWLWAGDRRPRRRVVARRHRRRRQKHGRRRAPSCSTDCRSIHRGGRSRGSTHWLRAGSGRVGRLAQNRPRRATDARAEGRRGASAAIGGARRGTAAATWHGSRGWGP